MNKKKIRKRDGRIVDFTPTRITIAISKAMTAVGQESLSDAESITRDVVAEIEKRFFGREEIPSVEDIQDTVEKQLILHKLPEVAKAYILYRDLRGRIRNINNFVDIGTLTKDYIEQKDWKVHENTSIDYSLAGLYNYVYGKTGEIYWLNEIFTPEMRELHINKDFHIHKLSAIAAYCVGWDLMDILTNGFGGVKGTTRSAAPKHFSSALGQLCNFMFTLTNEAPEGAVAVSNLDTLLAPFIKFDKLTYKEVKQHIQEFIFNLNCPSKVGAQAPFTNVTLDLECPKYLAKQAVVSGGKPQKQKYGEFQKEMDMFNKAFAEVIMEGDADGRVFSFPIPTYNISKNFDWDNSLLDPIWEMTAKYGIPYFANFVNSDMKPEDARSMCCRLRIDNRVLQKRGGALFGANPLTGSIGYVTINLPRLGHLYDNKKDLYDRLDYLIDVGAEALSLRRDAIETLTERGLYPFSKIYLRTVKERTGKYWSNHFNTIGIIGMNECCLNFLGKDITTKEGQKFALEMMDHINARLTKIQKKSGHMYNLEASPAEGTSYSMAKKDKAVYPDIIVANEQEYKEGAEPYYTNSTHLPVGYTDDLFQALELQDKLQCKYTGGTVLHAFLGERLPDKNTTKQIVRKIAENFKLPYFTITPTFSICPNHGYITGEHWKCPKCQEECEVYSRIVGKIHPVQRWNPGKKSEFRDRQTYKA